MSSSSASSSSESKFAILVIDSEQNNWDLLFSENNLLTKYNLEIEQTTWENIASVTSFNDGNNKKRACEISLRPWKTTCTFNDRRNRQRIFHANFVLVRKLVQGLKIDQHNYVNHLLGMMHCNLPSINSLHSIYLNLQRPFIHGILSGIRDEKGADKFPLIDQYYHGEPNSILFTPSSSDKVVIKVGSAEAGFGKVLLDNNNGTLRDFGGCITRYNDFFTSEPFIANRKCDIRLQKIGKNIRVYERVSSNWKGNVGNSILKEVEVKKHYKEWIKWVDEAVKSKMGSPMEIFTLDAIQVEPEPGKFVEYILEINDCASGLAPDNLQEDIRNIRDLVISKISDLV